MGEGIDYFDGMNGVWKSLRHSAEGGKDIDFLMIWTSVERA